MPHAFDVLNALISTVGFISLFFGPSIAAVWLYKQVSRSLLRHIAQLEQRIDNLEDRLMHMEDRQELRSETSNDDNS